MGITGLLPFVKNSCRPANLRDFAGSTVAIDAYSWLHKGAFSCAEKLVKGEKTDGYIFYCIKLLNMLIDAGVTPIMVFDGCNLASKAVTEKKRRENRDKTKQRGKELLCEGKLKEARECFQRCVDVTPEMAKEVIQACKKKNIDCIVAPYEADAQLAYLDKVGMAHLIITEDSDLILFGCTRILFKMDGGGGGLLYEKENLPKSFDANASKFSFEKFRYMCILSGCDYLPSLPGIGLAKSCKFFSLTTITDLSIVLTKLPSYLKMPKLVVSDEYKDSFIKANNTFLYQLAFCPKEKRLVPLNPYPDEVTSYDMEYAGKYLDDDLAYQLAMGNINVKTLKEFDSSYDESSPRHESKSVVWNLGAYAKESNIQSKKVNAFKFDTPKRKVETVQKRKCEEIKDNNESAEISTEDLFSQYGGNECKKARMDDSYEEDPLVFNSYSTENLNETTMDNSACENSPPVFSPPFKKIVKSRFFSPQSSQSSGISTQSDLSTLSSSCTDESGIFLSNSESSSLVSPSGNTDVEESLAVVDTPKKSNKENVLNRFAKKKSPVKSPKSTVDEISSPTFKRDSTSVLDVFNNEASSATSTVSSMQKCAKILCQEVKDNSVKIQPKKLFSKKLITKKIDDFNFKKEPNSKMNNEPLKKNLNSTGEEKIESSPEKDTAIKSPLKEISPYFFNNNDEPIYCIATLEEPDTVITLSDSEYVDNPQSNEDLKNNAISPKSQQSKIPSLSKEKLNKCRTIGLSKKRKSSGSVPRKETLLNFNFTRKSLPVKTG